MTYFNGPEYKTEPDHRRLSKQHIRIRDLMMDSQWRSIQEISEISEITDDPPASVSAQLRHLRKPRFGSWIIERRARGNRDGGLYEYRMLEPSERQMEMAIRDQVKIRCSHCNGSGYVQN